MRMRRRRQASEQQQLHKNEPKNHVTLSCERKNRQTRDTRSCERRLGAGCAVPTRGQQGARSQAREQRMEPNRSSSHRLSLSAFCLRCSCARTWRVLWMPTASRWRAPLGCAALRCARQAACCHAQEREGQEQEEGSTRHVVSPSCSFPSPLFCVSRVCREFRAAAALAPSGAWKGKAKPKQRRRSATGHAR
jgi:hypothetical protein